MLILIKLVIMSNFNLNDLPEDENVRPPDGTTREILIDYNNSNYNINFGVTYKYHNYDTYNNTSIIPNDYDDYDKALQLAFAESIKEQEEYEKKQLEKIKEQEEQEEYEKIQLGFLEKTKLRVQFFKDVLLKIKKISMIDESILEFYKTVESIIDSYCACNIDVYECDKNMYDVIFKTLKTIRLTETELELFKNLFVMEN
jgi:hypothetical protein